MKLEELILDNDKMYFLLPTARGDTFICCFLHKILEEKHNAKIIFIIQESHRFICEFLKTPFLCADFEWEDCYRVSNDCPLPRKGAIFVAHPYLHKELSILREIRIEKSGKRNGTWQKNFAMLPEFDFLFFLKTF